MYLKEVNPEIRAKFVDTGITQRPETRPEGDLYAVYRRFGDEDETIAGLANLEDMQHIYDAFAAGGAAGLRFVVIPPDSSS